MQLPSCDFYEYHSSEGLPISWHYKRVLLQEAPRTLCSPHAAKQFNYNQSRHGSTIRAILTMVYNTPYRSGQETARLMG